jgi:hypothetical protein
MIRRRRRHRRSRRFEWFAFALFLLANTLVYLAFSSHTRFAPSESVAASEVGLAAMVRPAVERRLSRSVYPYSVIRGGAYSVAEFDAALIHDPVASAHYAAFHRDSLRMTSAPGPRLMYASYRMGGSVYWTSHPVHVAAGESLITDGTSLARARCGNQLSDSPREPVTRREPMEREMETPQPPDPDETPAADTPPPDRILALRPPVAPLVSALAFEIFPRVLLSPALASSEASLPGARDTASQWPPPTLPPSPAAEYSSAPAGERGESSLQLTLQTFQQKNVAQVSPPVLPGVITGIERFPGDSPPDPTPPFAPLTTTSLLPAVSGNPEPEPFQSYGNPSGSIPGTSVVPEPVAGALLSAGVALLYIAKRRRLR